MSEETAAAEESGPDTSGLALDLAMDAARDHPGLRAAAAAFLHNQNSLVDLQKHHLRAQLAPSLWEKWLGAFLRLATAMVGIAFATALGVMVWEASHSHGLIVESFAVPPDLAARGLSGDVVASKMLDRLTALQDATNSSRAPQSYANNWGGNLKVEIPETGVSIGELQRFLKEWLGHDTRISGEVYRTASGIAVTARAGSDTGATFTGPETDLDALLQKAAEHVYEVTQPYRYANYLDRNTDPVGRDERNARAAAIYQKLIQGDDAYERAWALNGLGTQAGAQNLATVARDYYYKAIAAYPDFTIGWFAVWPQEGFRDNWEQSLVAARNASRLLHGNKPDVHPQILPTFRANADQRIALMTGDLTEGIRLARLRVALHQTFANQNYRNAQVDVLVLLALQHDLAGVRAYSREQGLTTLQPGLNLVNFYAYTENWTELDQLMKSVPPDRLVVMKREATTIVGPYALARAHLGDIAGAEALLAPTPAECDRCLLARAELAEMRGQRDRADWWFARAVAHTPSIPFAPNEWGRALLDRGKPDDAIAKFTLANKLGPKFADPLEGWGEALMAKNQSHLALAKFKEAEKYAPNWGRLHLKWGEALAYAGKKDDAAKVFARAAALDLTPSEKSELQKFRRN